MPMADTYDEDYGRPTRTFLYGPDKTKKTWWALRAAEAGFNVVLIDGDDGASINKQLPIEARKRILIIDAVNTTNVQTFARFVATFMRGKPFVWDEKAKSSLLPNSKLNPERSYVYFDVSKLTTNDVVILDSWTRLASSLLLEWANENNVDLTAVEKESDNFSLLNYQSRYLDFTLSKIATFPCHFIAIGHETVYEKYEGKGKDRKMIEQKTQPFSSTGPHAKKIGAHFSNILRFTKLSDLAFRIDAGGDANTMGGCRQLKPEKFDWKAISPATIFKAVGFEGNPNQKCEGAVYIPPGGELPVSANLSVAVKTQPNLQVASSQQPVVDATKSGGNISLLAKLNAKKE